jgi:hypothetical protein
MNVLRLSATHSRLGGIECLNAMTCILAVNWEGISAIGQVVGAFAVVISLIYVAREIRSNARAAREELRWATSIGGFESSQSIPI